MHIKNSSHIYIYKPSVKSVHKTSHFTNIKQVGLLQMLTDSLQPISTGFLWFAPEIVMQLYERLGSNGRRKINTSEQRTGFRRLKSVQFSSVEDGIYALGKAHMRSTASLRRFPNVAFETVLMFVWLTMALSCSFKEDRLALPVPMPLYFRRPMAVWSPWLCARR